MRLRVCALVRSPHYSHGRMVGLLCKSGNGGRHHLDSSTHVRGSDHRTTFALTSSRFLRLGRGPGGSLLIRSHDEQAWHPGCAPSLCSGGRDQTAGRSATGRLCRVRSSSHHRQLSTFGPQPSGHAGGTVGDPLGVLFTVGLGRHWDREVERLIWGASVRHHQTSVRRCGALISLNAQGQRHITVSLSRTPLTMRL